MPQRMASKCIATEQNNVDTEHHRTDADAERIFACRWIDKPKRFPNVIRQNQNEQERQIKKIPMHVLHDERERTLAPVALTRLAHSACRWIGPERFVVRATIIITGDPETARCPKNKKRRRK